MRSKSSRLTKIEQDLAPPRYAPRPWADGQAMSGLDLDSLRALYDQEISAPLRAPEALEHQARLASLPPGELVSLYRVALRDADEAGRLERALLAAHGIA